jgi:hypothetical protein
MIPQQPDRWREQKLAAGARVTRSEPFTDPAGEGSVQFRLTYEGPLLSDRETPSRTQHKHFIRKQIHPQLKRFWGIHPHLKWLSEVIWVGLPLGPEFGTKNCVEQIAETYTRANGYHFVPLVREELALLCSLDILYLRPAKPGSIISTGDIDNRLKTLFDALTVPIANQTPTDPPDQDEDPFYVLLEDDKLITHVAVTTDFLLSSVHPDRPVPDDNDARVIITINLRPYGPTGKSGGLGNQGFI